MAEKVRYTRKDLKGPDEFISAFQRSVSWGQENRSLLIAVAGCVLLLVVGLFGAQAYFRWKEASATRDLWTVWNRDVAYLAASPRPGDGNLDRMEGFLKTQVEKHPGTRAALYANYYLGSIAFLRGDYERAAGRYRAALGGDKAEGVMPFLLRQGLGQALEARGDFASASEAYRSAAEAATGQLQAEARLDQARTLALSGKKQDAAALYRQLLAETADPRMKELIEIKLSQAG